MSALRQALADYLAVRRVLGYKLVRAEKLLAQFLTYVEDRGEDHLTTETALAWATLPPEADRSWASARLSVVRRFAAHLRGIDPATEVPPVDLLPGRTLPGHALPLLGKGNCRPDHGGRHIAHATPGGDLSDFDRLAGRDRNAGWGSNRPRLRRLRRRSTALLIIRNGKFGKSRELPLHPSTVTALGEYLGRGDRPCRPPNTPALFVSTAGTRLLYTNVQPTFHQTGLPSRPQASLGLVPAEAA